MTPIPPARWAAVEALAHALLEHWQLGERDAPAIIIDALKAHIPEIPEQTITINAAEFFRPRLV